MAKVKYLLSICVLTLLFTFDAFPLDTEKAGVFTPAELMKRIEKAINENNKELLLSCYHVSTEDEQLLANIDARQLLFPNQAKSFYKIGVSKYGKAPFLESLGSFRYILENQIQPSMYSVLSTKGKINVSANKAIVSYSGKETVNGVTRAYKFSIELEWIEGRWYFSKSTEDSKQLAKELESLLSPAYELLNKMTPLISEASDIIEFRSMIKPVVEKYEAKRRSRF